MKTRTILCAALAVLLLCGILTACGMKDDRGTTTTTTTTNRTAEERATDDNSFSEMMRDNAETVSEMFSEGASELRDSSFLDPQNGMISDTQPNP